MSTDAVHQDQIVTLRDGGDTPIQARWSYRVTEPYAVTVAFQSGRGNWVEWIFARDLLLAGLTEPSGLGDVRVAPGETVDHLVLEVRSPHGEAVFELPREDVENFLDATAEVVPFGAEDEHFDVDRLIAEITNV